MATLQYATSKEIDIEQRSDSSSDADSPTKSTTAPQPKKWVWICVCISLYIGAFLYGLDTTISADVQASVYERFQEIEKLAWVGMGFPMGSVSIILLVGTSFAMFEIKHLIIGFFTLFEVGSAICGAAPTTDALIVGRVIAGMGGAGMFIGCLTYISVFTTLRSRPLYNALTGLAWGLGAILGPVVGGAFSVNHHTTWRWAFYINLPLAAPLLPAFVFLFPRYNPQASTPPLTKLRHIDWIGVFLNAATFVLFVVALTFSGSTWAWSDAGTIVVWVLCGVAAITYALQQTFSIGTTPTRRLFPVHLLKSRTMVLLFIATSAGSSAMSVCLYYIPLFFQFTRGDSAIQAAVRLLPFIVLNIFGQMFSGALMPAVKRYAPWYLVGGVLATVAGACLFVVDIDTNVGYIYGFGAMTGFAAGLVFQVAYSVVAAKLDLENVPKGIGFINVSQIGGITISLTIAGAVFQNVGFTKLNRALSGYGFPEAALRNALAGAQSAIGGDEKVRGLVTKAVVDTITSEYALQIAAGAVMVVCALGLRWERLDLGAVAAG